MGKKQISHVSVFGRDGVVCVASKGLSLLEPDCVVWCSVCVRVCGVQEKSASLDQTALISENLWPSGLGLTGEETDPKGQDHLLRAQSLSEAELGPGPGIFGAGTCTF